MNIRTMTIADYEQVHSLWLNTPNMGLNDLDDSKAGISKYLIRNPNTSFVATNDDVIVGAILCGHDGRRGFIYHLVVAQTDRTLSINTALTKSQKVISMNRGELWIGAESGYTSIPRPALIIQSDRYSEDVQYE
ncbi:MAG: hypothetical protein FWG47_05780 [Propionibacteriaceae bacterium]|nr:hypothetical protein [Propionibacteriaceae bacterium]